VVFCMVTPCGIADGINPFVEIYHPSHQGRSDCGYRSHGIVLGRKIYLGFQERWLDKYNFKCLRYRRCIKWWAYFKSFLLFNLLNSSPLQSVRFILLLLFQNNCTDNTFTCVGINVWDFNLLSNWLGSCLSPFMKLEVVTNPQGPILNQLNPLLYSSLMIQRNIILALSTN
jgi:hypothetical protein